METGNDILNLSEFCKENKDIFGQIEDNSDLTSEEIDFFCKSLIGYEENYPSILKTFSYYVEDETIKAMCPLCVEFKEKLVLFSNNWEKSRTNSVCRERDRGNKFFQELFKNSNNSTKLPVITTDSELIHYELNGNCFKTQEEQRLAVLTLRDKWRLNEKDKRFNLICDTTTDLISIYNQDVNLIYIIDSLTKLSGFTMDDVICKRKEFVYL